MALSSTLWNNNRLEFRHIACYQSQHVSTVALHKDGIAPHVVIHPTHSASPPQTQRETQLSSDKGFYVSFE